MDDLWLIRGGIQEVIALSDLDEYASALSSLDNVTTKLGHFALQWNETPDEPKPIIIDQITHELTQRKTSIIDTSKSKWNDALSCSESIPSKDSVKKSVSLKISLNTSNTDQNPIDYDTLLDAIQYLDDEEKKKSNYKFHSIVDDFLNFVDHSIFKPILELRVGSVTFSEHDSNTIILLDVDRRYNFNSSLTGVHGLDILTKELTFVLIFLKNTLSTNFSSLYKRLQRRSSTRLISTLLGVTLTKLLPKHESELAEFEPFLIESSSHLQQILVESGWLPEDSDEILSWAKNLYSEWISHKKLLVLNDIRQTMLKMSSQEEFDLVRVPDEEFAHDQNSSGLHNQEQTQHKVVEPAPAPAPAVKQQVDTDGWDNWNEDEDDENVPQDADDGWGDFGDDVAISDDDDKNNKQKSSNNKTNTEPEDEDGWGAWGDDDDDDADVQVTKVKASTKPTKVTSNPHSHVAKVHHEAVKLATSSSTQKSISKSDASTSQANDMLLCSISNIPISVFSIITEFVNETHRFIEHHQIPQIGHASTQSSKRKVELQVLEKNVGDLLALFRALSVHCYIKAPTPFILYNDVTYLMSQMNSIEIKPLLEEKGEPSKILSLPNENEWLFALADAQYSLALSEQEVRLEEVLQKANKFQNCNGEENLFVCQGAIERTINIFYEVSDLWEQYISFPLKAKALGTLLEYVASTMIKDIESQENISAEESTELSKLIKAMQQLESLFRDPSRASSSSSNHHSGRVTTTTQKEEEESRKTAALVSYHTPSWIKFQYLEQLLVSNLEEISFLFHNHSLVDFTPKELDGLIHALFSPSDKRRETISMIYGKF